MIRQAVLRRTPSPLLLARRSFSSSQPRIRIPSHVAAFTLLFLPVLAFTAYASQYGQTEEELEQEISSRYQRDVNLAKGRSKDMAAVLQRAFQHDDKKMDQQLDELIRSGAGGKKRMYSVDDKLYGTAEGTQAREKAEQQQQKKLKKKKRNKAQTANELPVEKTESQTQANLINAKSVAAVTGVAAAAVIAGVFLGGRKS